MSVIANNPSETVILADAKDSYATVIDNPSALGILAGVQGVAGRDGNNGVLGTFIASESMPQGMPVFISRANGQIGIADASVYTKSFVAGFTVSAVQVGFAVDVSSGLLTLPDWTAITGTMYLLKGTPYFLAIGGGLASSPPNTAGVGNSIVKIGNALNSPSLYFSPLPPILF